MKTKEMERNYTLRINFLIDASLTLSEYIYFIFSCFNFRLSSSLFKLSYFVTDRIFTLVVVVVVCRGVESGFFGRARR